MIASELVPYINRVGFRLEAFKQSRPTLWNSRCPICGDSGKRKNLRRFYIHLDKERTTYMASCRNCNYANGFINFLKDYHGDIHQDLVFDLFKNKTRYEYEPQKPVFQPVFEPVVDTDELILPDIHSLPEIHPIVRYLTWRRIFKFQWSRLSYCNNFKVDVCSKLSTYKDSEIPDDMRLLIPFYDQEGNLTHLQARAIEDSASIRYITLKIDESKAKVYGLDQLDINQDVYVVEGPIDSLFLPNCVATADSNLMAYPDGQIYVADHQYRNRDIVNGIDILLSHNKSVVLFPPEFKYKDINDAIKGGVTIQQLYSIIKQNTFSGMQAQLKWADICKLRRWKK